MLTTFTVKTGTGSQMVDITRKVEEAVAQAKVSEGICTIYVPHTTAGVTINENADPSVVRDMLCELEKIVPWEDHYQHLEGNSAAHIKASMMGFSQQVIVHGGRLLLGTWQGIYLCEFDGPRTRKVHVSVNP